jgi:hypothetical protein
MEQANTKLTIGEVRFSYLTVFEPRTAPGNTQAKYSATLLIPKSDTKTITAIVTMVKRLAGEAQQKNGGKLPPGFKNPMRDGDEKDPLTGNFVHNDEYRGHYFLRANSVQKPSVVDTSRQPIMDATKAYSGMWGYAALNFFVYLPRPGVPSSGIGVGLNHVMKTKDDTPFAGRESAEDAFKDVQITGDSLAGGAIDPLAAF